MTGDELVAWRRHLHRHPEPSGDEAWTAAEVAARLTETAPDEILRGLGGHGVAAVYSGTAAGPTVMIRCELDGLPIVETSSVPHRSVRAGHGHLCGHDGHMAIVLGVAYRLAQHQPRAGRAILLFQPAEEDGSGAAAVLADPRFAALSPDWAFALHNMPGLPLGHASLASGPVNCASLGLEFVLEGRTAHASRPHEGTAPTQALAELMPALTALSDGEDVRDPSFRLVTVTHARLGEPTFGVAPGTAVLRVTLRTLRDDGMDTLLSRVRADVSATARHHGLAVAIRERDVFSHCDNDPEATALMARALEAAGVPRGGAGLPMRGSEDFGRFGGVARSAMVLLGSGERHPGLHAPDYDFPDALIPIGTSIFATLLEMLPYKGKGAPSEW